MRRVKFYVYKGMLYTNKLRFTRIINKQIVSNVEYITLKRWNPLLYVPLIAAIIMVSVLYRKIPVLEHKVAYNSVLYCDNNILQLNMYNPIENRCPIRIVIYDSDGLITKEVRLEPGEGIGNVLMTHELPVSSAMCRLEYTIEAGWRTTIKEYSILITSGGI